MDQTNANKFKLKSTLTPPPPRHHHMPVRKAQAQRYLLLFLVTRPARNASQTFHIGAGYALPQINTGVQQ
jgi:hypothetical protein